MGIKIIANNKKAYHEYFIDEVYEAGLALQGTEVKSIRMGQVSIKEAYCRIRNGEVFVDQSFDSACFQFTRFHQASM